MSQAGYIALAIGIIVVLAVIAIVTFILYRKTPAGFAEKYLDMLRAGGSKRHKELLAPFGLNAADPEFWKQGLGVIEGFIDELETLS